LFCSFPIHISSEIISIISPSITIPALEITTLSHHQLDSSRMMPPIRFKRNVFNRTPIQNWLEKSFLF
ncbi:MAG: hypothetical protein LBB34_02765, partial [Holosporales bacterium]|nr:hypothetical protein [Holosporales bacterium]